jgi:hypothetical protein
MFICLQMVSLLETLDLPGLAASRDKMIANQARGSSSVYANATWQAAARVILLLILCILLPIISNG